jgi:lipopolysaccharide export LptBFGC system permease protein LptF
LLGTQDNQLMAELQWRLSLPLSILVLTFPGGADGAGQSPSGRYAKLLPAILLYLSYFLLLSAARSAIDSGRLPHWPGMFLVPLVYLLLIGLPLNLQGTSWWNGVKGNCSRESQHDAATWESLLMFGILDRYIGRVIFMSILLCELTLVGLAALIKYVEQLKAVGEGNYDMLNALYYVLLSMPKEAVLFFPLAALLGGLIGLGQLATSSELVVMQAAGRSKISIVMAALKTAIPLMLLVGLMGEYVAPAAKRMADDIKAGAMSEGRLTVSAYGVWARDGNNFVNINGVRNDGALTGITLYRFTPSRNLIDVVQAKEGCSRITTGC